MADMRRVRLTHDASDRNVTSTYNYENKRYFLKNREIAVVNLEVANAWVSADSNVLILPEK